MKNKVKLVATFLFPSFLAACGGGGGGGTDSPTPAVPTTYQVWQAWVNYVSDQTTRTFTVSGTVSGVGVSGSGTVTAGALASTTFEGQSALVKTTVVTGTVTGNGISAPYGGSSRSYVDSNYQPRGYVNSTDYAVISGPASIPQTAKINDTGTLYSVNRYTSNTKSILNGTTTISWALQPDSGSTALLKIVQVDKSTGGTTTATTIDTFRMTPAGGLTPISEEYQSGTNALTLRY